MSCLLQHVLDSLLSYAGGRPSSDLLLPHVVVVGELGRLLQRNPFAQVPHDV